MCYHCLAKPISFDMTHSHDFEETLGTPAWYAYKEHWFAWYDGVYSSQDNIHVLNLGKSDAHIQIYITGVKRGDFSLPGWPSDLRRLQGRYRRAS
jgi:hypothetical protein